MIYPERNKRRKRKKLIAVSSFLGSVFILITVLNVFAPHLFSPLVHAAGRPILISRNAFSSMFGSTFDIVYSKSSLIKENRELKKQVLYLEAYKVERDIFKKEKEELQALLGKIQNPEQTLLTRILSKPGYSPYDTLVVDNGELQGIRHGAPVFAVGSVVLGAVTSVYSKTSIVTLYSSPDHKIEVLIGESALQAVAVGKGGGNFEVKLPKNSGVIVGDVVVVAHNPTHIIGTIGNINSDQTDSFEQVLFKSPVDIGALKYILISKTLN